MNPISYAICATLLFIWSIAMLRSKSSRDNIWFALAFAAATTILLGYHRPYDAKLLLLTVPLARSSGQREVTRAGWRWS